MWHRRAETALVPASSPKPSVVWQVDNELASGRSIWDRWTRLARSVQSVLVIQVLLAGLLPVVPIVVLLSHIRSTPVVKIDLVEGSLVVRLGPWDALYCVRRQVVVPQDLVLGVAVAPAHLVPTEGKRLPGTALPGVIRAGSYGRAPTRTFWNVRGAEQYLVIELRPGAGYERLVLEVPDPSATALRLRPSLGAWVGNYT